MRGVFETLGRVTDVVRVVIGVIMLIIIGSGFAFSIAAPSMMPGSDPEQRERIDAMRERAITAKQERERAQALADDGWGTDAAANTGSGSEPRRNRSTDRDSDWGY